jgi:phospholipid/cholesterol/gamma-HCH transport system substrate-binding protein
MASQKTKFTVGLFLASGIAIGVISVIWLGTSRFLEKGNYYVTYFNESVQGLDVDSPVKYRGVPVGRVQSIGVAPDSRLIKVVLKIESGQSLDRDITAQMKSVGITGAMFVELDRKAPGEPDRSPPLSFPSEYPIVASEPSDIRQIFQGLDEIVGKLNRLDIEGIVQKLKSNLDRIEQTIADVDAKGISQGMQASLHAVRRLVDSERWETILGSVEESAKALNTLLERGNRSLAAAEKTLEDVQGLVTDKQHVVRKALDDFRTAMENANLLLEKGSSLVIDSDDTLARLRRNLLVTGQNLEKASDSLNQLLELVTHQPSQLLFGEPPTPRRVEPDPAKIN